MKFSVGGHEDDVALIGRLLAASIETTREPVNYDPAKTVAPQEFFAATGVRTRFTRRANDGIVKANRGAQ
jgi:hypothetical protein